VDSVVVFDEDVRADFFLLGREIFFLFIHDRASEK